MQIFRKATKGTEKCQFFDALNQGRGCQTCHINQPIFMRPHGSNKQSTIRRQCSHRRRV